MAKSEESATAALLTAQARHIRKPTAEPDVETRGVGTMKDGKPVLLNQRRMGKLSRRALPRQPASKNEADQELQA